MNEGTAFPGSPYAGQTFYRTDLNQKFIYCVPPGGGALGWQPFAPNTPVLAPVVPSGTADPTAPVAFQLFFRTDTNTLKLWTGSAWKSVALT